MEITNRICWGFYSIFYTVISVPWNLFWRSLNKGFGLVVYIAAIPLVVILRRFDPDLCKRLCTYTVKDAIQKVIQTPEIEELLNEKSKLVRDLEHAGKSLNDEKYKNYTASIEIGIDDDKSLEKRLRSAHYELQEVQKKYAERLKSMQREIEGLQKQNSSLKAEIGRLKEAKRDDVESSIPKEEINVLQRELALKDDSLAEKDLEIEELENDLDAMRQNKEKLEGHLQIFENDVKGFNLEIRIAEEKLRIEVLKYEKSENENKELRITLQDTEKELADTKTKLMNSETEKDDALKRLSEIMSLRLRDNNPNIVDLNDQFRPTKLAEMMNELYDNQWTDVFSYLEDQWESNEGFSDEMCIEFLLNILMETYIFCQEKVAEEWNEGINKILWIVNTDDDKELLKKLKDVRRKNAFVPLPSVNKDCLQHLRNAKLSEARSYNLDQSQDGMKQYVEECVRVCWLMALQDPPVCLLCDGWERSGIRGIKNTKDNQDNDNRVGIGIGNDKEQTENVSAKFIDDSDEREIRSFSENNGPVEKNEQRNRTKKAFDKDLYKEYTRRGQFIEYVVWPLMYLHKDGPLLNKGIAQGCNQ